MGDEPTDRLRVSQSISDKQIKAIWALSHRAGVNEEDLHAWLESRTGKKSIRFLSRMEAREIIEDLLLKTGDSVFPETGAGQGQTTRAQMAFIGWLGREIGWDLPRLGGLAKRMYGVRNLWDLKARQASGLIEALKAIQKRQAA